MIERTAVGGVVGDCYRVEAELGRGGMARVYRVVDERNGRRFALKKLIAQSQHAATEQAMFEREYHALVQLAHPHIVRAFDYGLDPDGPYYTMELLEGGDARETNRSRPLDVRQICSLLRDAASALALIHSRRLVHRDLSPRNLWCTPDGKGKLIDFGTLTSMGTQTRGAGTAPFMPPEAVHLQPLDARSDIYGLGALAYYLLTHRHAYPARETRDLRRLWQRRPRPPIAARPEIPRALSELVMAMLNLDPRGRPSSAAEVCERLTLLAELPCQDARPLARAFLTTPTLVGRGAEQARVRATLLEAMHGRGNTVAIVAAAGLGRTRMLSSLVLEAKLLGATAVVVDAAAVGGSPFAVATAFAERLLETAGSLPQVSADVASVLGELSPTLRRALGQAAAVEPPPQPKQPQVTAALLALAEAASQLRLLVIAIDDVHLADNPSLGMLSELSLCTGEHRLMLGVTCDAAALAEAAPALARLASPENTLELGPLGEEHTHALLGSLFGEVPALDEAARWLHQLSAGSPRACMLYAQYLVDHELARYEAGHWQLAEHLRERGLPATLAAVLEAKVSGLSADAAALALGLVLARDETRSAWQPENHVRVEDFPKLLDAAPGRERSARAFGALDELLRAGLVEAHDQRYVLTQAAVAEVLLATVSRDSRRRAHERLADIFGQSSYSDPMLSVRHLQAAELYRRSLDALLRIAAESATGTLTWSWGAQRVSVAATCAERQLADWARHGGAPRDGIVLRRMLLVSCSVYDWRMARCGDEQVAELCRYMGLGHWGELDGASSPQARLSACMQRAERERAQLPEPQRGPTPQEAAMELVACALPLTGALVNAHELARARSLASSFAMVRALSPLHTLLADLCDLAVDRIAGRAVGDRVLDGMGRLYAATELLDLLRLGGVAVYLQVQALEDARRGRKRALELLDALARATSDRMLIVVHGRWVAHAFRGESAAALRFRQHAEITTEDDAWRRKAYLFVEAQLHALSGDFSGLKRTCDAIAELAELFPGWRPWLSYCRGEMQRLRGELGAARVELEAALAEAAPGEHRAWNAAAPAYAELLLAQGMHADAEREASTVVERVDALSLDPCTAVSAERVRALAQSGGGRHAEARTSLERAFALARELGYGGLPLARLHEARARVELAAGATQDAKEALASLQKLLEQAEAPALVAAYEALLAQSMRLQHDSGHPELAAGEQDIVIPTRPVAREQAEVEEQQPTSSRATLATPLKRRSLTRAMLDSSASRDERARKALELLLEEGGAHAGHLLLFDVGGVRLAASIGLEPGGEELLAWSEQYLARELGQSSRTPQTATTPAAQSVTPPALVESSFHGLAPLLLSDVADGQALFVGLALNSPSDAAVERPPSDLVSTISRALLEAGDSIPLAVEY